MTKSHHVTDALPSILGILLLFATASHAAELYGVTGSGGTPSGTLHLISQTDASVIPLVAVGESGGGHAIAFNPDDGYMYHWAGFPSSNTIFERIDLDALSVTDVPLSGAVTNEVFSATYDATTGGFLTTDPRFQFHGRDDRRLPCRIGAHGYLDEGTGVRRPTRSMRGAISRTR